MCIRDRPTEAHGKPRGQQQIWSPFTNSMGPAMSLPKYARASDIVKGVTNDARDAPDILTSLYDTSAVASGGKSNGELPALKPRSSAPVARLSHAQAASQSTPYPTTGIPHDGGPVREATRPSACQNDPLAYTFQPPPLLDVFALPKEAPHRPHSLYNAWQPRPRRPRPIPRQQHYPPQGQNTSNTRTVMGPPPPPHQTRSGRLGPSVSDLITSPQPGPRLLQMQPQLHEFAWGPQQHQCSLPMPVFPPPGRTSLPPLRSVPLDGICTQLQPPLSRASASSLFMEPPGPLDLSRRTVRPLHPISRLPPLRPSVPTVPAVATYHEMPRYPEYALPAAAFPRAPAEPPSAAIAGRDPLVATSMAMSTPYSVPRQVSETLGARQLPLNPIPPQSLLNPPQRRLSTARPKESGQPGKTKGSYTFKGWIAPM